MVDLLAEPEEPRLERWAPALLLEREERERVVDVHSVLARKRRGNLRDPPDRADLAVEELQEQLAEALEVLQRITRVRRGRPERQDGEGAARKIDRRKDALVGDREAGAEARRIVRGEAVGGEHREARTPLRDLGAALHVADGRLVPARRKLRKLEFDRTLAGHIDRALVDKRLFRIAHDDRCARAGNRGVAASELENRARACGNHPARLSLEDDRRHLPHLDVIEVRGSRHIVDGQRIRVVAVTVDARLDQLEPERQARRADGVGGGSTARSRQLPSLRNIALE